MVQSTVAPVLELPRLWALADDLECRFLEDDIWCHHCGQTGVPPGTAVRTLVHVLFGWQPTMLQVRVHRYRCPDCYTVWRQDTTAAAASRTKMSRDAVF